MAYSTQADIINLELEESELIDLTDDRDAGTVDAGKVTAAIAKADAEIDAYCQAQYTVPFSPTPDIVTGWSATLAAFGLFRNRPKPETLIDRYNKVMSWLKAISENERQIPGEISDENSDPGSTTDGTAQTFRRTQYDENGAVVGNPGTMDPW